METELIRYVAGGVVPRGKDEKAVARRAQVIYDDARIQAMQVDAQMAVARHAMEGVTKLDRTRKVLCSPEDQALNSLLSQIELEAFDQVRDIMRRNSRPLPRQSMGPWDF